jgi:hypothetical protein
LVPQGVGFGNAAIYAMSLLDHHVAPGRMELHAGPTRVLTAPLPTSPLHRRPRGKARLALALGPAVEGRISV